MPGNSIFQQQFLRRTYPAATKECQTYKGRLFSPRDCFELEDLRAEMLGAKEISPGNEYWIGNIAYGLQQSQLRRADTNIDLEIAS